MGSEMIGHLMTLYQPVDCFHQTEMALYDEHCVLTSSVTPFFMNKFLLYEQTCVS